MSEENRQVIFALVPEIIRQSHMPEKNSNWHQVGNILRLLDARNKGLMRQKINERNFRDSDGLQLSAMASSLLEGGQRR